MIELLLTQRALRAILLAPALAAAGLFFPAPSAQAQSTSGPAADPLMTLMMSQPPIDVDSPVIASARFEPPIVKPGETAIYRVVFNALEVSIAWPENLTADAALNLRPGGRGQILQMTGTNLQPHTTFLYRAQPNGLGRYVLAGFSVDVYGKPVRVPAASLEVTPRPPPTLRQPQTLELNLSATNVYVGQAVTAEVRLFSQHAGIVQGLTQVQLVGDGFVADHGAARQRIQQLPHNGSLAPAYIYELVLTPLAAGELSTFAQAYAVGNRLTGPIVITGPAVIPGGISQYSLLDSSPVQFRAKPLPAEGKLPGFTGAVGRFVVEPPKLGTNVFQVGEPFTLAALVRGQGNLGRLVAPPPPAQTEGWQIVAGSEDHLPPQVAQAQGFAAFQYTLVPLVEGTRQTPAIPFSYFDPVRGQYEDLTIPPVTVAVLPGGTPADLKTLAQADAVGTNREPELKLSGLAAEPGRVAFSLVPIQQQPWFPLLQLAPGVIFLALFGWDRRRRYLEQHPEVVLRRRARRALRKQRRRLHDAIRAGDGPRFASAAVEAMRIAGAPHYPAEPRALVCSDILPLLPESDRSGHGGEVVRHIFAVSDAARFATEPAQNGHLLALHSEFEQVLARLEEKL